MPDIDSLGPLRRAFTFRYVADSVSVDQDIRPLLFEDTERRLTGLAVRLNSLRKLARQTVAENRSCPEKKDRSRHENKNPTAALLSAPSRQHANNLRLDQEGVLAHLDV